MLLSHGFYYPAEAFLSFYKVVEMISQEICTSFEHELKSIKENELGAIASRILNERRLDDSRHSRQMKVNRIKNLINKYIKQKEITAKGQVVFACNKLGLSQEVKIATKLIKIRNQGGIAHSSKSTNTWLKELRQCRDLAREFIIKYLISKNILEQRDFEELMKVPSGVHISKD